MQYNHSGIFIRACKRCNMPVITDFNEKNSITKDVKHRKGQRGIGHKCRKEDIEKFRAENPNPATKRTSTKHSGPVTVYKASELPKDHQTFIKEESERTKLKGKADLITILNKQRRGYKNKV